jgi:HAD superfamily hydrolase (TIGR01509 family)
MRAPARSPSLPPSPPKLRLSPDETPNVPRPPIAARAGLSARGAPVRMVIFDCDGVLIDSEAIAGRVVADALAMVGWRMTPEEAQARFLGHSLRHMVPMIEAEIHRPLPCAWLDTVRSRMLTALAAEAPAIPGAVAALEATTALGLPWRIASNSSHEEMAAKFGRNGMTELVAGRCHSHRDVAHGKPAPDLFLAAAAAEGMAPADCLVVEDSIPGVRGARAARMDVLGFDPHGTAAHLAEEGAWPLHDLADLPGLLRLGMRAAV